MDGLKCTPLTDIHRSMGAKMAEYANYEMPILYTTIQEEHLTVRHQVGIFDVSHMGEILIEGEEAEQFVSYLFTNDIVSAPEGKVVYGFILYPDGGVVDDLLIYKYHSKKFLLVVNAANKDKDYSYICEQKGNYAVTIENRSDDLSEIAIQGPMAEKVLQTLTDQDLSEITFFTFKDEVEVAGIRALVSRTGYTGEDGFEVYTRNEDIAHLWNKFLEVGAEEGLKPIGLGARDTLRFEAALPLYGNELSPSITPIEAGFKFFVKLNHEFIGREALEKQVDGGLSRKIVALKVLDKGIIRHGYPVYNEQEEVIGEVTTGYLLPGYDDSIAFAMLDLKYTELGSTVYVEMRKKRLRSEVITKKFMNKNYKK